MILEDYEALKCRYPSKKCWNQRAVKRNGERHNLCEMHRQKANNNQRRLDKKRKAGHMLKGGPSSLCSGAENELPEYDAYHQQHNQHHPHSHSQSSQEHYEHQQEKRMRVRLTDMYIAAQSLSPHSPHSQQQQRHQQHLHHRERELAPLLPRSPSHQHQHQQQQQVLHLPPLTSHIPLIKQSTSPQSLKGLSAVGAAVAAMKPTILLPPITSVPRCQYPGSSGSSVSSSPHPGWSGFRYGAEEPKVNTA